MVYRFCMTHHASMYSTCRKCMQATNLGLLLALGLLWPSAHADRDAERSALAQVIHELNAVEVLIEQAASQTNRDARIRFRYDWLRQDLERIRRGIREHIDAPRAQPRTFAPLRGDYRR